MKQLFFGKTNKSEEATLYVIGNRDVTAEISDYGATLVRLWVRDKKGLVRDVVLGYDRAEDYEREDVFFGATVGRCANRIAGGAFDLYGVKVEMEKNAGIHSLHGGRGFYNKRMWTVREKGEDFLSLTMFSPHLDQGFPGKAQINVTYRVTEDRELRIEYKAVSDRDTIINLTNHSYFNLNGHNSGTILNQIVQIDADYFTETDEDSIPTGNLIRVENTPMDFRIEKCIGRDIETEYEPLIFGKGYDHNYVLNGEGYRRVGYMRAKESGIKMEIYTDDPGMQFYTANYVDHNMGKGKVCYERRSGACFETQYFPDAVHHEEFQTPLCEGGKIYSWNTAYRFFTD